MGTVGQNFLGALIADRRRQAGYSQADLARLLPGVSRSALNSIEGGTTKTISPVVANELVKILPVSMPELVRAMGFDLPGVRGVAEDIAADLASAPEDVLAAVRLIGPTPSARTASTAANGRPCRNSPESVSPPY